ncbi:protein of unknown function [Streptomyces sp. KY75]|nr:protein of unknown function [Streptomyces sp. KY75]CAD5995051.1 protein of unknown function [Streptomyces sp. KY70]
MPQMGARQPGPDTDRGMGGDHQTRPQEAAQETGDPPQDSYTAAVPARLTGAAGKRDLAAGLGRVPRAA